MKAYSEYDKQADFFLKATGATIGTKYIETGKHFPGDTDDRDIYKVTIARGTRKYTFRFGQSVNDSGKYRVSKGGFGVAESKGMKVYKGAGLFFSHEKPKSSEFIKGDFTENKDFAAPSAYDVIAAVQKSDPGTFEDFCADFGFDTDSRTAERTYKAVVDEYRNIAMLFSDDELEAIQEIS